MKRLIARRSRVAAIVSLFLVVATGCSRSRSSGGTVGAVEQPWSHAWSGEPNGWWTTWKLEKAPFPEGTRFEFESIEMDGSRGASAWVARSLTPGADGTFSIELTREDGSVQRPTAPPPLPSSARPILSRNEKLVSVTTPAGTFLAGRLWSSDRHGDIPSMTSTYRPIANAFMSGARRGAVDARREQPVRGRGLQAGARMPHQDDYLRFIRSTVAPGSGIGGLKPGDSKALMFDVLGPTKTFKPLPDGGEQYYYGPNVIEVAISISPPPARAVRRIELSSQFQGQTPGGGRIGDPRDRIKRTYPGTLAVDLPGYVVYCDGTTFLFRDGRLDAIRLADLDSDVFKDDRLSRCSR